MATAPAIPENAFRISSHYQPFPHQAAFHCSSAKNRVQIGSFGSGKSKPLMWEGISHCLEYPGTESIILRTKYVDLELTVINKFKSDIPREVYDHYDEGERTVYFHRRKRRRFNEYGWIYSSKAKSCLKTFKAVDCFDQRLTYTNQCEFCQQFEVVQSKLHFGACNLDKDVNKYLSTDFVFIGFEEMGEFSFVVFDSLCNRNRCSYPGSRPCVAGATNPMGTGWPFIKRLFVDKKPLREMDADKYDPADYEYFHSTIDQNPILFKDKEYVKKLEASPLRKKIRYGDVKSVSGNYFKEVFDPDRHVQARSAFKFLNYQSFVIGWDYGFGHYAVILWLTKAFLHPQEKWGWTKPRLVNVFTRELVLREHTPRSQTEALISMIPRTRDEHGQETGFAENVDSVHFSWERFNRTTSDYTVAMEVGDLLSGVNLPRPISSNRVERIAGWTKMYSLFETDELFILETEQGNNVGCPCLQEALPELIRGDGSKVSMEDVVKPKGLSLNDDCGDACLGAGTLIDTARGLVPIEDVTTNDFVLTRKGFKRVLWSGQTGIKPVMQLGPLTITGNHPVYVNDKFVIASDITWPAKLFVKKKSFLKAARIVATQRAGTPITEDISVDAKIEGIRFSTSRFTEAIMDRFRPAITSITKMKIASIIRRIILRPFLDANICETTERRISCTGNASIAGESSDHLQASQTHIGDIVPSDVSGCLSNASSAERNIKSEEQVSSVSVQTNASQHGEERRGLTIFQRLANTVARNSQVVATALHGFAPNHVQVWDRQEDLLPERAVFNLSVEGEEEYFANGVLVHNCRYAIAGALLEGDEKPKEERRREELAAIQDPMARSVAAYTQYNKDRAAERSPQRDIIVPSWMKKHR